MPTIPQHKTVSVAIAANDGPFAIPDSSKYTRFLIILTGCTPGSEWQLHATVGKEAAPVPVVCGQSAATEYSLTVTKSADNLAMQVQLASLPTGGLSLVCSSEDNAATGEAKVSMWGSAYSHPQRG